MNKKTVKQVQKKTGEELQQYLSFKRRGSVIRIRKGKGSYTRKEKYRKDF